MICKKCYTNNEDGAKFCIGCGEKLEETNTTTQNTNVQNPNMNNTQNYNVAQNTQNYNNTQYNQNAQAQNNGAIPVYNSVSAIIAIVASFLCCGGIIGAIFGILSLVDGSKVKEFVNQGNIEAANLKLKQAKKWNMIAWIIVGVGAAITILTFGFSVLMGIISEM